MLIQLLLFTVAPLPAMEVALPLLLTMPPWRIGRSVKARQCQLFSRMHKVRKVRDQRCIRVAVKVHGLPP